MFKYLLLPMLLLCALQSWAQNHAAIKGKIIDSADNKPVDLVTIAVLSVKDTSATLHSYTISDKTGTFSLHNLPAGVKLKIFISNVAYKPFRKFVTLTKGQEVDLGEIKLSNNQLGEVNISADRPPMSVRKDTIEFNAEAFKTRPNAVVEGLLRKLPGLEVNMEGKITVQGHNLSKVLVNSNEFFNNDYRIATKNLDVDMVDKIQIYDDRENDPNHLIPESRVDKIINIKLKKALKRSAFGKIMAGGGTKQRYSTGGLFNFFRDTLQVSVLGIANNLNNTGFSYNDLDQAGGFNRGGSSAFYKGNISFAGADQLYNFSDGGNFMGFSGFGGSDQRTTTSGGVNVNQDYGKKLKINIAYFYNHTHDQRNNTNSSLRTLADTIFNETSRGSNSSEDFKHNVTSSIVWKPDDKTELSYRPSFSYSTGTSSYYDTGINGSNFIPLISKTAYNTSSTNKNASFEHFLNYDHKFKKEGMSVNLAHSFSVSPDKSTNQSITDVDSYTAKLTSYNQNQLENNDNGNTLLNFTAGFRYPFTKKLAATVTLYSEYNLHKNQNEVYDFNAGTGLYDIFVPLRSAVSIRSKWDQSVSSNLSYEFSSEAHLSLTALMLQENVHNVFGRNAADINQNFFNILPRFSADYHGFSLSYVANYNLPSVENMQPYETVYNPQYKTIGNPNLKRSHKDEYAFGYGHYFDKQNMSVNGSIKANFEQDGVVQHQTIDGVGTTVMQYINTNGRFGTSANVSASKYFKLSENLSLRSTTDLAAGRNRAYFEINNQGGFQNNYSVSAKQRFEINWKDLFQLEESYAITKLNVKYTDINYTNVDYVTHVANTHLTAVWPKIANFESTYAFVYNPLVAQGFKKTANLLNLSIGHSLLAKDRGEIKLSCYDILNQNVSQMRYVEANLVYDQQSQILRRYFLLTLQYKFNKTVTKK